MKKVNEFALTVCVLVAAVNPSASQTANATIGLTSLVTGQLSAPTAPTITQGGTPGSTTYTYGVVAVDLASGHTTIGPNGQTTTGNAALSGTNYNIITTPIVSGAASCDVYRTSTGAGYVGTATPCGGSVNDVGGTLTGSPPGVNTTGSIKILGNLQTSGTSTAPSFIASGGSTAGGDSWVTGSSAISVVPPNSVTMEAPSPVPNSYAIIMPSSLPTPLTGYQVMLFGPSDGATVPATHAIFGTLDFDSSTSGLGQPSDNGSFTYPNTATNGFTLSGNSPSSSPSNGTNAMPLLTVNNIPGGATSATGAATAGVGSSPSITAGTGGAATGSGVNSTTIAGQGGSISLTSGTGGQGQAGNDSGGSGGNVLITTGPGGGAAGSGNNSNGGNVVVALGKAGTGGSGSAGASGYLQVTGTAPSVNSTGPGFSVGTLVTISGVAGGGTSSSGATAGTGSVVSINSGNGGAGSGSNNNGGAGGALGINSGQGGGATGTGTGGSGAAVNVIAGAGGTASSTGIGGTGGSVNISAGAGGNPATGGTNGNGGNIVLTAGVAGTGGTSGSPGIIQAQSNVSVPTGTGTAPALQFSGNSSNTGFIGNSTAGFEWVISGVKAFNFYSVGILQGNAGEFGWSSSTGVTNTFDTGIGRGTAGVVTIDTSSNGNASGLMLSANTGKVAGSDYSVMSTANTITGLSWTLPAVAKTWSFNCNLAYNASGTTRPQLSLYINAQQSPSSEMATAEIFKDISAAAGTFKTFTVTSTSSGSVLVLTGDTPVGGNNYIARLYGSIEASSTSGTFSIQAAYSGGSGSPAINILRGSFCQLF